LESTSALLLRHKKILFAYVYGSFLEDGPFRDVDLAIYMDGKILGPAFFCEDAVAQELVKVLCPVFPVDVRLLNGAPLAFQFNVLKGRLLFARDENQWVEFVSYVVSRYLDMKPLLDYYFVEAFRRGSGS